MTKLRLNNTLNPDEEHLKRRFFKRLLGFSVLFLRKDADLIWRK